MLTCLSYDARRFFLLGMRIFFGIWLFYAGYMKLFVIGPTEFVGMITTMFDATWSPHALNVLLAWLIIIAEPAIALWILSGWKSRIAWSGAAWLMFMLMMGQSLLMKPEVADMWQYLVLALACAALSDPERPAGGAESA